MRRCKTCVMPDTRPDVPFTDGECQACINYRNRPEIYWSDRAKLFDELIRRHANNGSGFDCIIPSSGGKDSHAQVKRVIDQGWRPLVVTATTCDPSALGRRNIENLGNYATTIQVTPNRRVRKILNRIGLEMVGDISWPEHVSIFTTPFRIAVAMRIPLILYGENPQNQYGGPFGTHEAMTMTRRWRSEFGGFLGLRPSALVGYPGLTTADMSDYQMPGQAEIEDLGLEAHFLGQYFPWDSRENADVALEMGMKVYPGHRWWEFENLDNHQTGVHDYLMFRKYGYGRLCTQISVDIRAGLISREAALEKVRAIDWLPPSQTLGAYLQDTLAAIGVEMEEFQRIVDQFTDTSIVDRKTGRLIEQ